MKTSQVNLKPKYRRTFNSALIFISIIQFGFFNFAFGGMKNGAMEIMTEDTLGTKQIKKAQSLLSEKNDVDVFVPYEVAPAPVGGYAAIHKELEYPELAKMMGLEGDVVLGVLIDEKGTPIKTQVRKGESFSGFAKAAKKALMAVKWQPAKQRDRAVKVWVWVPIYFKIHE